MTLRLLLNKNKNSDVNKIIKEIPKAPAFGLAVEGSGVRGNSDQRAGNLVAPSASKISISLKEILLKIAMQPEFIEMDCGHKGIILLKTKLKKALKQFVKDSNQQDFSMAGENEAPSLLTSTAGMPIRQNKSTTMHHNFYVGSPRSAPIMFYDIVKNILQDMHDVQIECQANQTQEMQRQLENLLKHLLKDYVEQKQEYSAESYRKNY